MNIKKLFGITLVILALFACLGVASAGWFDFFDTEPANETYNFTVCSFDLPENASIFNYTTTDTGYQAKTYTVSFGSEDDENNGTVVIIIMNGTNLVDSIDEFVSNWQTQGASSEGTYGEWTIINVEGVPLGPNTNATFHGYVLARHNGDNVVSIRGTNLTQLKHIADTYKPI